MSISSPQTYPDPESYFTIGPYITDPQKFFGREELQDIPLCKSPSKSQVQT